MSDTTLDAFCADNHIALTAMLLGYESDGAKPKDKRWSHFAWRVTLTVDGRAHTTDYKTGTGHARKCPEHYSLEAWLQRPSTPTPPSTAAVLSCLLSDGQQGSESFESFCSDLGYDTDSRSALDTYLACQATHTALRRLLGPLYSAACEAAQDY